MSLVSSFGYTNTTAQTFGAPVDKVEMATNYALIEDEPNKCVLSNTTAPVDQGERVSYSFQKLAKVSTDQDVLYPSNVPNGVQYSIRVEELLSTTDTADPTFRVDDPIVAWLTIRHPSSGRITSAILDEIVSRLNGCVYKDDGTTRFGDLMRSALKPTAN